MTDYNVRVVVDPRNALLGSIKAKQAIQSVGTSADRLRTSITRAFGALAAGAGITAGVQTLAQFSQEMSTVRAVTGATGSQFKQLRDAAKSLGATTRFSATQAAEGMTYLARAGFDTDAVLSSIDGTLELAQAGALDLGSAADIASNILTGFRMETDETARVVDVLAFASNGANTKVGQLGEAMKYVAPIASGVGVNIESATAAVSALSDAGLQASLAGTGLRRILSELESPSTATVKIFRKLGLAADDVKVSQVGLIEALTKLRDAGVDTGLGLQVFGDQGGPAFEILSKAIPKVTAMTQNLNNAKGAAARMAAVMNDNLNGALLSVKSAIEALVIEFGDLGAESILTGAFRGLAALIRNLAVNIDKLVGVIATATAAWMAYAISVKAASGGMLTLLSSIKRVAVGLVTLLVANPFAAIAAAIVSVIGLLATFSDKISLSTDGVITLRDYAVAAFQIISEAVGPVIDALGDGLSAAIDWAREALSMFGASFGDILSAARTATNAVIGYYVGLYRASMVIFSNVKRIILDALGPGTVELIVDAFRFMIQFLIDSFKRFAMVVLQVLKVVGVAVTDMLNQFDIGDKLTFRLGPEGGLAEVKGLGTRVKDAFLSGLSQDYVGDMISLVTPAFEALEKRARKIATDRMPDQTAATDSATLAPTPIPAVDAGPLATQSEAVKAQLDLYEQIKAPIREYAETLSAANGLLDAGKISIGEYNAALQQTQLGGAMQQLQIDLMPEGGAEIARLENTLQQRLDLIEQFHEAKIISEQEALALSLEANKKHSQDILNIEMDRFGMQLQAGQTTFTALTDAAKGYAGEQSEVYRAMFALSKGFAIAETTVAIAQGVANSAKLGWPQNIPAIASTVKSTAGLLGQIQSAQLTGFQNGGSFRVGGSGDTDSQLVAFRATPNETVSVRTPGQERAAQQMAQPQPAAQPIQIVNVDDPGKLEDFMATPAGTKSVLNIIKRNPAAIKSFVG